MSDSKQMEIAIIGAGLLFPAKIESLSDLWNFMMQRGNAAVDIPPDRWSNKRFYSPAPQTAGKTTMAQGNFILHDAKAFDCAIFGLSPREASLLDPLQRNILLAAWRAIEDAKLAPRQIKGTKTGVYVGAFLDDFLVYAGRSEMRVQIQDHYAAVCSTAGMVSARLGHVFNLLGPAMSVDTACSSSMTAIVRACEDLSLGNCEMALAGGSSYMMIPEPSITMSKSGFLAKDGRSKSFSDKADGYGRGEGAGILLLKPLAKALEDKDPIRAVISAGALNQDGRTSAVPVPSRKAQSLLMKSLLEKAGVHPDEISAVEAHGAGTPVGDPIEAAAISGAIAENRSENLPALPIGSIKANIGHLEASAGVAGVMRAMLCLENKTLPPWPCEGKPAAFLSANDLYLPVKGMKLSSVKKGSPHYILANSFGYGGANAAVLMRSFQKKELPGKRRKHKNDRPESFFILSAASGLALKHLAKEYADFIENFLQENPDSSEKQAYFWQELCENLLVQRDLLTHRLVLCRENRPLDEMVAALSDFAKTEEAFKPSCGKYQGEISDSISLENIFLLCADSPAIALREGAVFLLDLPARTVKLAHKLFAARQLQFPDLDLKAEIFSELREAGKFQALSPFVSALLQISAGEYLQSLGLKVSASIVEMQKSSQIARTIALYFNQKLTPKTALAALCDGQALKEISLPSPPAASLALLLGNAGGQHSATILKRKFPLETALKDAAASLLADGAGMILPSAGGRNLVLPIYPMGLEFLSGPERLTARKDRIDLTVHPLLGTLQEGVEKSWKADLTTGFLPWLPDHAMRRKTGQASDWLFPFAAFVEAGLAAHKNMTSESACVLENMTLKMPLFPARDLTTLVFWHFYSENRQLKLTSLTPSSLGVENPFLSHGSVTIAKSAPWCVEAQEIEADTPLPEMEEVEISTFYQNFRRFGIYYGPAFRSVKNLKISGRKAGDIAIGEIVLPENAIEKDEDRYLLHPVLLDGAFQMAAALMPEASETSYAPSAMTHFIWHGRKTETPLRQMRAKMILKSLSENELLLDGVLYDFEGHILGEIRGLECVALAKKKQISLLEAKWESLPPLSLLAEQQALFIFGQPDEVAQNALERLQENGRLISHFSALPEFEKSFQAEKKPEKLIYFPSLKISQNPITEISHLLQEIQSLLKAIPLEEKFAFCIAGQGAFAGLENVSFEKRALWLAPLVGFIRSARVEYPSVSFKIIFFQDKGISLEKALAAELVADSPTETEIFLEDRGRYGLRANPVKPLSLLHAKTENPLALKDHSQNALVLIRDFEGRKFTQGLGWETQILPKLSEGQVRVKTIAAGLNFKDFLNVMGLVPEFVLKNTHTAGILGLEALVEIEACPPEETELKKGDLCLSFVSGAFTSRRLLQIDKTLLFPIPKGVREEFPLSMIKALAGFSVAAATAWACLVRLANLEQGESILIHSAAGGVGQMALQIAQLKGARIFATAGSEERREWLRRQKNVEAVFDSRTLAFYDGIKTATGGRGVDVVLNVLSGEALQATLKLMAPFGRFVEIGKRDIIEGGSLNLTPFNENLAFFSYDLDRMLHARPEIFRQDCRKIYGLILERKIIPPQSTFFPMNRAQEAFRHFASNAHSGRIILDFCPENVDEEKIPLAVRENPKNSFFADLEAAHLITGGTGGFGMETLRWLLKNGARSLHVVARKDPSERQAWQDLLAEAQKQKAEVIFHAADFSNEEDIQKILLKMTQKRKLGAIFHAAGYLKDGPLVELSLKDMADVLQPKISGALSIWNVCEKLGIQPSHFMLYSSLAGFTGNFGQAAYGAANVFLDVFAGFLREKGVNAFSIGWGAIAQGGMMKRGNASAIFRQSGIGLLKAEKALESMAVFMQAKKSWGAVAIVDWPLFFKTLSELGKEARFSLLNEKEEIDSDKVLLSLPPAERRTFALRVILEEISAILQLETGGVTARTPLESLGLDSLAGMELQVAVQKRLGVEVPVSILATARTPDALAGKIAALTLETSQNLPAEAVS
ncbi:SDR family NAD(P)-dependent oxidoreductase [Acetobacteraceae bacterium]|nr:SDR family NAD(P)-dependent oxidoreductase [Acetobacteraceae bacterium]